jgi:hypothetical protein
MLDWLESSSIAVWLRESPSVWALPTVLTLHTMGMAVLVGASWVLDLRVLGISRNVPLSAFRWVFPTLTIGLIVNVVTGVLLFLRGATTLGTAMPFFVKMLLVIASVATVMPMRSLVLRSAADERGGVQADAGRFDVGGSALRSARVLAVVSILSWTGAVTAGRLLAYLVV